MKIKVIHGLDFRDRWKDCYANYDDVMSIENLKGDEYQDALFNLFEYGFSLDLNQHEVVEY